LGIKVGVALLLHWAFGVVFGIMFHEILGLLFKHFKQRIMKIDYQTIGKKIWCGALAEMLVRNTTP
jgi:hypothetical protein